MGGQLICENLRNLRIIKKRPQITQIKKLTSPLLIRVNLCVSVVSNIHTAIPGL